MRAHLLQALLAALSLAAAACGDGPPASSPGTCGEIQKDIPVEVNRDIDILFVIDNSASMAEEQASLAANFHRFANVLENIEGGLPNVHIGVLSTDVGAGGYAVPGCTGDGDDGLLQATPRGDCTGPQGAYISDIGLADGSRQRNYTGTLDETLACIAALGTDGCAFTQPLESVRRALAGSNPANAGFLRPDAFLFVAVLTGHDDCSASDDALFDPDDATLGPLDSFRCFETGIVCDPDTPRTPGAKADCQSRAPSSHLHAVRDYADYLRALKEDPAMVVVSMSIGNPTPVVVDTDVDGNPALEPSCVSASGEAQPGIRLAELAQWFPQRATLQSICNEDLSDALTLIATTLSTASSAPCIGGAIDLDPDTAGIQAECVVTEVRSADAGPPEETLMRACTSAEPGPGELPCWRIAADASVCPDTETGALLEVVRGPVTVPAGSYVRVRCSTGCELPDGSPG